MIELKTLPLKIGNYTRDNTNSRSFLNKEIAKGYTISDDLKTLIFGTWRPVGAVLKKVSVDTNDDVIECIEKGIIKYLSDKQNSTL